MNRFFVFLLALGISAPVFAGGMNTVMDIYSGKGTPCENNTSYTSDPNSLQYLCINHKTDGKAVLLLNGVENSLYNGVENAYFSNSGTVIADLRKESFHAAVVGKFVSDWYITSPMVTIDTRENFAISYQDGTESYGWKYNGVNNTDTVLSLPSVTGVFGGESILILDVTNKDTASKYYWYDRVFLGGKRVLSEYSNIVYEGEYTRGKETVVYFLAQKGNSIELLAMKNNGSFKVLKSVSGKIDEYITFAVDYSNPTHFAFVIKAGDKYKVVTNEGVSNASYESVVSLWYYPKLGLYKNVLRDGKNYFSIGNKGFGPYDTVGMLNISNNSKSWYINVSRGDKEYLIVNGNEMPL